jgi:hypothetical protein
MDHELKLIELAKNDVIIERVFENLISILRGI